MEIRHHVANLEKHGVSLVEVDECFADSHRILRAQAGAYWLIAKTEAGRLLDIGFVRE
jgi:uncharacterized DUF497 family protein